MNSLRPERVLWLLLAAGACPLVAGLARAAAPAAGAPAKKAPGADLLEFLGSVDSDSEDGWREYLENTDLERVASGAKTRVPAKPATPPKATAVPPAGAEKP